jgi:hypothetical protein
LAINQRADKAEAAVAPVLSLIFAEGQRPGLDAVAALAAAPGAVMPFALSHIPEADQNWVELLSAGLTFDLHGLSHGPAAACPGAGALLGLADVPDGEAIALLPAPHLADGPGVVPVVRVLAGIGMRLASLPGVLAAHWQPSGCWMTVKYYNGVIAEWLGGGAFPALGLTSLRRGADGAMTSVGLDFFIGQELRFESDRRLPPAAIAKAAVRLVHSLVESGPLRARAEYAGPEGTVLVIEPDRQGRELRITVKR